MITSAAGIKLLPLDKFTDIVLNNRFIAVFGFAFIVESH